MASAAAAASSSSSQRRYDVFLSFRGEDTRNNFTAHLYHALCQKGINTFIDDDKLERGQVISPALVAAIENSMFSIVVLSKNYASSRWCLEELVKIVECMKSRRQKVLPIFYNVDPSDVRRQRGIFGEELAKHEENLEIDTERVQSWKDALTQVANLSGWDSRNKNEPLLIKEIVTDILNKLLITSVSDTENLVGIDARVQEIEMRLCLQSDDLVMVGIWGMGGIGKTTLAKVVYKKITSQFEACSFFENVGEDLTKKGLIRLQQKFLSQLLEEPNLNMKVLTSIKERLHSKKVLIVLDNVNNPMILKSLIGNKDWFGRGSKIIITTRDKRLLISHGVLNYYEAQRFNYDEALKFLSHYSLKHQLLRADFMELSKEVIYYAQGIPLALEVLGSFLFSMTKEEWRNQLDKLKSTPNMEIQEVLKVSYDGLDDKEKNIFLDIACFFNEDDKDHVMEILDGCGFFSLSGIRALIDKSLITISSNKLMMHDLIQEMGREIVRQQSPEEPGNRSRLWFHEDIYHVLKKNTANEKIEGIFLNLSDLEEVLDFTTQAFARMNRLRLLKVYKSENISRNFNDTSNVENCKVNFSKDFKFCYHDLRYLYFHGYSLKSLPNDFNPKNLVELKMPHSHITQLWKGIKVLEKLKFMDLSHSKCLIETPNFLGVTNLKQLVLEDCVSLCKVHSSLGNLKNLSFLNLKNCKMLKSLPSSTCDLKSLETFILSGCSKFEEFPENFGSLEMLTELYADEIALRVLPTSFSFLRSLKILSFKGCKGPPATSWFLPISSHSIGSIFQPLSGLCSLIRLDLSDCNLLDETNLSILGFLSSLEHLYLEGNDFVTLPSTISRLSNLNWLKLGNCKRLQVLPELPSSICHVDAENCTSLKDVSYQVLKSLLPTSKRREHKFKGPSVASKAFIPGSRIPDWIRYQSSGSRVEAELPPNWFNSKFLGFALSFVSFPQYCQSMIFEAHVSFDWTSNEDSSSFDITASHLFSCKKSFESDHVCLFFVPLRHFRDCSQVTRIKVSFEIIAGWRIAIKRSGVGLVYSNEDGNHNIPPMIQFDSSSSPLPPPPNKSTVALEEIHEGEPSGNQCSNVDGSEVENSEYHTAYEEEPSTASACSEDDSESDMRPQKRLKCRD